MLGAGLGGYGGYDSPEGLAEAHGMGYGDNEGNMGGGYDSFMRGLIEAYSKYYGGNSSLLGHNRSVFGGPMMTSGPTDVQGAMIGSNVPTDANPSGFMGSGLGNPFGELTEMGQVSNTPSLASVNLMGQPNYSYYGQGGPLEHNLHNMGIGPNYNGIGISFPGGHPGSVGPMGPAEGGGEPYIRPRRLAYRNAYDQDDPSNFFGGM